jgi:hypothetical protein
LFEILEEVMKEEIKEGYAHMSESGRRVAEFIELSRRYEVQEYRSHIYSALESAPGLTELKAEIQKRYSELFDNEQDAVMAFGHYLTRMEPKKVGGNPWETWLKEHLAQNPSDTVSLYLLEHQFPPHPYGSYPANFAYCHTWRMHHEW